MQEDNSLNIKAAIAESAKLKELVLKEGLHKVLTEIGDLIVKSILQGGKVLLCGNGGSAADAQHLTAEFVSRLRLDRHPLPALTLGTNSSNLSAIANDYGYNKVFAREIISSGKSGDLFIPISTSGNSENVILAIEQAKKQNISVIGWTGKSGGKMSKICKTLNVPTDITEKIQECHIMIGHIMCAVVEKKIFNS